MRKIGFIGAYDKTDFILYLAKILTVMGQKVLVIDGTITQKARYIVPTIEPTTTYVTQFEEIDIAVGLHSIKEVKAYSAIPEINELPYDIALIDVDTAEAVSNFEIETCEKIYFTTSFDMYSIRRGMESISGLHSQIVATKVLFSKDPSKQENDFLNYLSSGSNIRWNDEIIYFPFEHGDQTVIYNNQRVSKIKFRRLSNGYKDGMLCVASQITGENNYNNFKKIFKKIEKGV